MSVPISGDWQNALNNPHVTDICVQGTDSMHVLSSEHSGRWSQHASPFPSHDAALEWVIKALSQVGKTWDARRPFCDFAMPPAHRAHAVFAPVAACGIALSIRRLGAAAIQKNQWLPQGGWTTSADAFAAKKNILICGGTGSGKTTLLNDLLSYTARRGQTLEMSKNGDTLERCVLIEDTPELFPNLSNCVSLRTRIANTDDQGEVTQRQLVRQALRMRPDRIILGECRGDEVLDLLTAANTGHRGIACTLHANSAREAIHRIELLAHLAYPAGLPEKALRTWISLAFQTLIYVREHRIVEILETAGCEDGTILLRPVVWMNK